MQRLIVIAVLTGTSLAPLNAEANPYAAYLAKFLGEYLLDKCLDEVWDAVTGTPDLGELDSRLRAFEGALSQVDARLSGRIAELGIPSRHIAQDAGHQEDGCAEEHACHEDGLAIQENSGRSVFHL